MTDREALRSMLVYAQREAESLQLTSVAQLLVLAVKGMETGASDRGETRGERIILTDLAGDCEFHGHFETRRLQ